MKLFLLSLISLFLLNACQTAPTDFPGTPKNVILVIGDGMGPQQISALYYLTKYSKNKKIKFSDFAFKKLADRGVVALSATEPAQYIAVDSASSANQLAIGQPSLPETVGLNENGAHHQTILEKAKARGLATGLVSDTLITHATPAAFASYSGTRYNQNLIAENLFTSQPDIMFSGGAAFFLPQAVRGDFPSAFAAFSRREDDKDLLALAKEKGYELVFNKNQMIGAESQKVLGLFAESGMPTSLWQNRNEDQAERTVPNLLEMTQAALQRLSQNPQGYFLMVEAGQIDWACHANDVGLLMHEMFNLNKTLNFLISWVERRPDTLLIVTADHETGGFGFTYQRQTLSPATPLKSEHFENGTKGYHANYLNRDIVDKIFAQKQSFENLVKSFKNFLPSRQTLENFHQEIQANTDFTFRRDSAEKAFQLMSQGLDQMGRMKISHSNTREVARLINNELAEQSGVSWANNTHTATPVNVFSYGPKADLFKGYLDHVTVGQKLQEALGL